MRHRGVSLFFVVGLLAGTAVASGVGTDATAPQVGGGPRIVERTTYDRTPATPGSAEATIRYDIPSSVAEIEVTVHPTPWSAAEVVGTTGFERSGNWSFRWTDEREQDSPSIRIRLPLVGPVGAGESPSAEGTEFSDWALVPNTGLGTEVRWRYFGESPAFEQATSTAGQDIVTDAYVLLGPHRLVQNGTGNGSVHVVVVDGADPAASPERVAGFLGRQQERFDVGTRRPVTAFVLPNDSVSTAAPLGQTAGRSFWVRDTSFSTDEVDNTPAHEFVHTRTGSVGEGRVRWLREATAQYNGALLSLNDGVGRFATFHRRLTATGEETASVVLSRRRTFADNEGEYVVGAQVLAALDAQIRRRTDGERTLADVYRNATDPETGYVSFDSAEGFREAVVRVSGAPELGDWIERYTTTTERPAVPNEPSLFVTEPSLDPDGDRLESGTEAERGTNPFAADSDHDGLDDDRERSLGTNASAADTDGDGLTDGSEVDRGLDPSAADTDGDGVPDGEDAFPADASRAAAPTESDGGADGTSDVVVWLLIGLWAVGVLAGLAAVVVGGARVVHRLSGTGARLAEVSLRRLVLVAVGAGALSVAVLLVSSL